MCDGADKIKEPPSTWYIQTALVQCLLWSNCGTRCFSLFKRPVCICKKIPLCKVAQVSHSANICSHCCMLLDDSVAERGKKEDHNKGHGNCVYKLRIRRILLHRTLRQRDAGLASKQVLAQVEDNKELWYELMAKNIRLIEKQKTT